jgi:hypothetical protein
VIELIEDYLTEYRTKKEIIGELAKRGIFVNERTWRLNKPIHNKRYFEGLTNKMLVHSQNGYKLTDDEEEIIVFENDLIARSRDMEEQVRQSRYARKHRNQKSIFDILKTKKSNIAVLNK